MAFWKRDEELPPALRGKSPEEIAAALAKLDELQATNADLLIMKTTLETDLNTQKTELQKTQERLAALEANPHDDKPSVNPNDPPEPTSPWVDPAKFVAEQTLPAQAAAFGAARMAARITFKDGLSARDRAIFGKFEKEVEQVVNSYGPMQQGMVQNWNISFHYVKGLHEQEIAKMGQESSTFFSEPASRGPAPDPVPVDKLTPEEEEVCRTFHWDPVGYLKRKKEATLHQTSQGASMHFTVPERTAK